MQRAPFKRDPFIRPIAICVLFTTLLVFGRLLPSAHFFANPTHYLPLHTMLEFVAMAVSSMVFALGWNLRRQQPNSHAVLLGCAALCVALIDLGHTLSYKGMPDLLTPSGAEKAINFWLAGRLVAALSLVVVAYRQARLWSPLHCHLALTTSLATATAIWWICLLHPESLPRTFIPGSGLTPLKI